MFKREPLHDEPLSDSLRELRQRGDGFRLPDNYLNELRDKLPVAEQPTARVRRLSIRRSWLAIAASVALLLTLGWAWLYQPTTTPTAEANPAEFLLDDLSDEDILAYVEDNIGDFELSLLYETQADELFTISDDLSESLSDEDIDALYYELIEEE